MVQWSVSLVCLQFRKFGGKYILAYMVFWSLLLQFIFVVEQFWYSYCFWGLLVLIICQVLTVVFNLQAEVRLKVRADFASNITANMVVLRVPLPKTTTRYGDLHNGLKMSVTSCSQLRTPVSALECN